MRVARGLRVGIIGTLLAALPSCHAPRVTPQPEPRTTSRTDAPALHPSVVSAVSVPVLQPVLADPRLARVRTFATDHDWSSALGALAEAEAALTPDLRTPSQKCAWVYSSARLLLLAGRTKEAALAFDQARHSGADGGSPCPLATYAGFHAADAYLKTGDFSAALDRARDVDASTAVHDDAELVIANALAGEGRAVEAIPRWRAAVAKNPKTWIDVALPLASALLDCGDGDENGRAAEAARLATRIVVEAPKIGDSSGAEGIRVPFLE